LSKIADLIGRKLENLPASPGVYLFHDARGKIIYIGKGKNLRHRVRSYFQKRGAADFKSAYLAANARDLDIVITDSEVEALILESALVKKHQPLLNIRLKDDKSFLHLKVTTGEEYPRVLLTRRVRRDKSRYFGPYLPASLARTTIKVINRHFQLRTCSIKIDGTLDRPCLEYHIKRCLAPCVKGLCNKDEYARAVKDVLLLLEGKNEELIERLTEKMLSAAAEQRYEAAAFFRDRIDLVRSLAARQKMAISGLRSVDVFAFYREGPRLALQLFILKNGTVVGKREFFWEDIKYFQPAEFLKGAIQQYYLSNPHPPDEIHVPVEIHDRELIEQWLTGLKEGPGKVRILIPQKGRKFDLLVLVERNAKQAFESRFRLSGRDSTATLECLRRELGLAHPPSRIEGFDISNIQGSDSTAAMVVCQDGRMVRREYRKFKIKTVTGSDDFASINEVVYRRYKRILSEKGRLPDLILIDGGKGQLHAAYQALAQLEIEDVPLAAIAKKEELLYLPGEEEPIRIDRTSPALLLIQQIRDEAHRFAVSFHRKRRSQRDLRSELDEIPGIGAKRRSRLLRNFDSIAGVRRATVEELEPYLGRKLAETVKLHLDQAGDNENRQFEN